LDRHWERSNLGDGEDSEESRYTGHTEELWTAEELQVLRPTIGKGDWISLVYLRPCIEWEFNNS
jgi:hypothetical protein